MYLEHPMPIKLEGLYDVEKDITVHSDGSLEYREEDDGAPNKDFLHSRAKNGDAVITVVGPSGTGKTTNAKRIAADKNQMPGVLVRDVDEELLAEMKDADVYNEENERIKVDFIGESVIKLLASSDISSEDQLKLSQFFYNGGGESEMNFSFIKDTINHSNIESEEDKRNLITAISVSRRNTDRLEGQTIAFKYDPRAQKFYDDGVPFLISQTFSDARKDTAHNYVLSPPGCVIARQRSLIREIRKKSLVVAILATEDQREVAIKGMEGKPITLLDGSREKTFAYREGLYIPTAHVVMPFEVLKNINNMRELVDACIAEGNL